MSHYDEQREQAEAQNIRPKYQRMKEIRAFLQSVKDGKEHYPENKLALMQHELNMLKTATKEEYINAKGNHCPHCGSKSISAGSLQADGGEAWQEVTCDTCGEQWNDIYKLTNIEKITGDAW